ncbi:CDP-glucose 4,6-dehydratase [Paenibacillus oenotherae]|uniref:CDP-glucose 4,6-dehydratase n=1 Tax=Paenibacillus oenotherae TaxID=1435645 RepID=A0ABS7D0L0_9BACL|nr:CDP-glucose 4,6-dehydratase [Paenibacillus oenotherae]MBW7473386.1 CDP-glucose 4,6-dehydratase [Paenibacillus oenotherae]
MNAAFWQGKNVFVTGHTGFKGTWLCMWLRRLGAEVKGYSDGLPTSPAMHRLCGLELDIPWLRGDIRDAARLKAALRQAKPDIVFHLAAQPLVLASYDDPVGTLAVNVIGTAALLEAVRGLDSVRAVIAVTSDKCYANDERPQGYRESDPLGGDDPYSASKACAELVVSAFRQSYYAAGMPGAPALASVRAGNVIGGGDFAADRIVPDCVRAAIGRHAPVLRRPEAIRPWQHVLEPLAGYLALAEKLYAIGGDYAAAWNFGPRADDARTAGWLAEALCARLGSPLPAAAAAQGPAAAAGAGTASAKREAGMLRLDSSKAQSSLGWRPRWDAAQAVAHTADWYLHWMKGAPMRDLTAVQIAQYETALQEEPSDGAAQPAEASAGLAGGSAAVPDDVQAGKGGT